MKNPLTLMLLALCCFASLPTLAMAQETTDTSATKPNVVFILADDWGYGEVSCLNPDRCKVATPKMDQLASQGMIFTDAHTSSSVC